MTCAKDSRHGSCFYEHASSAPRVDRCAQARVPIHLIAAIATVGLWPQMRGGRRCMLADAFQRIKGLQHKNICSNTTKMVSTVATTRAVHSISIRCVTCCEQSALNAETRTWCPCPLRSDRSHVARVLPLTLVHACVDASSPIFTLESECSGISIARKPSNSISSPCERTRTPRPLQNPPTLLKNLTNI